MPGEHVVVNRQGVLARREQLHQPHVADRAIGPRAPERVRIAATDSIDRRSSSSALSSASRPARYSGDSLGKLIVIAGFRLVEYPGLSLRSKAEVGPCDAAVRTSLIRSFRPLPALFAATAMG